VKITEAEGEAKDLMEVIFWVVSGLSREIRFV
jgi:hypothetical protein